jgi:hypothetical protein
MPPTGSPVSGEPTGRGAVDQPDEAQPSEEELRQLARELSETPVEDIIANHCYGLFELAALHLSQQPVNLVAARLAIDAMGQLVDGLGQRLGPHAATLADGLTQLRLAFVRIAEAAATPASGAPASGAPASGAPASGGAEAGGAEAGGAEAGGPASGGAEAGGAEAGGVEGAEG